MYGWRVRIGHVAPSRGDTLVYEFYQMLPAGFMMLNSTGTIRQLVDADLERQLQRIDNEGLPQRWLRKSRRWRMAIDLTLIPYHGEPCRDVNEVYRGEAKSGTTHFHA